MKLVLIPIILILLITPVLAPSNENFNLQELKTSYNNNINKIPWIAKKLIGNERINLYLTTNTGKITTIGITTKKAIILSAQEGEIEKPTLNIYVTETTINKLKNQQITIQQAIDTEEIKYESQRIRTSIKLWLINLFT